MVEIPGDVAADGEMDGERTQGSADEEQGPLAALQRLTRTAREVTARRREPRADALIEPYAWVGERGLDPRLVRTRQALAHAFVDLVADSDVAGLSIAAVAGRAGLSRQTARSNIAGLADLALAAVADRLRTHMAERIGEDVEPSADGMADAVMAHGIEPLLGAIDDDRLMFQRLHAVPAFDRVGTLLADLFRDWTVRELEQLGSRQDGGSEDLVTFIVNGMVGMVRSWVASPLAPGIEEQAERMRILVAAAASASLPPVRTARLHFVDRIPAVERPILPGDDPTLGLALGGGGALGAAHVGVLKALDERGIHPAIVAGTSAGSIVGAAWAAGASVDEMESWLLHANWGTFGRFRPSRYGLLDSSVIVASMGDLQDARIEDLPRRFAAVATDVRSRTEVILDSGSLSRAIRASMAVPGVFHPIIEDDRILMDGGMVANLPIGAARALGADRVIAVRLRPEWDLLEVSNITGDPLELEKEPSVLSIRPQVSGMSGWSTSDLAELIEIGHRACVEALDSGWPLPAAVTPSRI